MRNILRPDDVRAKTDDCELVQEYGHSITDLPVSNIPGAPPNIGRGTNTIQREENAEHEEDLQRQTEEVEEEPIQTNLLQRQSDDTEEEKPIQSKPLSEQNASLVQRQEEPEEEEEAIQAKPIQRKRADMYKPQSSRFGYVGQDVKAQRAGIRVMLRSAGVQAKLTIGEPNDKYEQEADRVADQVMTMPDPELQRQPEHEEEEEQLQAKPLADQITPFIQRQEESLDEEETAQRQSEDEEDEALQAKSRGGGVPTLTPGIETRINMIKSAGQPLDSASRAFFESRFTQDFSSVRVHHGGNATEVSRSINARAFTLGNDIVFGSGEYQPGSQPGRRLLAHELTHVVQQSGRRGRYNEKPRDHISRTPEITIQRTIQNVQQDELVTFFSQPEGGVPRPLLEKYMREPSLMATQRNVIRDLVGRVQAGEAPLTADGLLRSVQTQESDLGTALIICHNITKALDGDMPSIGWDNVSRDPDPLVYTLSGRNYTFEPANFHPDAVAFSTRGESVFYAMLSPDEFGIRDEGDWYHYYAMAAASYSRASETLQTGRRSQQDFLTQWTGEVVRRTINALRDSAVTDSPAYQGWLLANAMSFLEGGHYGDTQDEIYAESDAHIQGASRGLTGMARIPEENWKWYVPRVNSISDSDIFNFHFREDMIDTIREGIEGDFQLTIISGSTPDHWYDTPDCFVKLPGWLGSRTTTKVDTPSPVWNEVLTTLSHDGLNSVTLELYDEDPILNDHITDFSADLRPEGQRSRQFSLTSGSSTLEVRVEAIGNIILANP